MSDVSPGILTPLLDSSECRADLRALRERATRDGYLWMRGLHDRGAIDELRSLVLATCEGFGWLAPGASRAAAIPRSGLRGFAHGDPRTVDLQVAVLPSAALDCVRRAPALLAVLRALLAAEPVAQQGDVCRVIFPGADEHTTPPHQDGAYVGVARPCWTVWTPLMDCPLELGPLAVLPGSPAPGLLPHAATGAIGAPEEGWAAGDLAAGDALLFHSLTLHRALPNRGTTLRLSVDCRYRAAAASPTGRATPPDPEGRS